MLFYCLCHLGTTGFCCIKAWFPLPELTGDQFPLPVNTGRVDGSAFPLAELKGPSTRLVETRAHQHECWWVMETGHPSTRAVNSDSGNWALMWSVSISPLIYCLSHGAFNNKIIFGHYSRTVCVTEPIPDSLLTWLHAAQLCWYCLYSGANFSLCTDRGIGPLLPAKFHLDLFMAWLWVYGPLNLEN